MAEEPKRQIAVKIPIIGVLDSEYVKQEGWAPNYIKYYNKQIARVNIIAVVISKNPELNKLTIDDGSANIQVRSFDELNLDNINIGDIIIIIGRPREYNTERYILPEIIKKIDNKKWIEVRKKELQQEPKIKDTKPEEEKPQKEQEQKEQAIEEEKVEEETTDNYHLIINTIRKLDHGEGADIDEVLKNSKIKQSEEIINRLIEEGEVFEIKPGKIKILE